MTQEDQEFLKKLRSAFKTEAAEHLQAIVAGLMELESSQDAARRHDVIATVFREAHSLKGAARTVNARPIEMICQGLEGIFASWRRKGVVPSAQLLDPLHLAINVIGMLLSTSEIGDTGVDPAVVNEVLQKLSELETTGQTTRTSEAPLLEQPRDAQVESGAPLAPGNPSLMPGSNLSVDTIRISTAKLDDLLLQAEEMLVVKMTAHQRATDLQAIREMLSDWNKRWGRFSSELGTALAAMESPSGNRRRTNSAASGMTEFLEWGHTHILSLDEKVSALVGAADHDRRTISSLVEKLLADSKKLLMLPFATLFEPFPKLVRDLSRNQAKEVELTIRGGDVEIDKRILEELKDPLVQMLRNSIDHGIEPPETRLKSNKPARGAIDLTVSQAQGNKVELVISDDGGGINTTQLRAAAVRQGILSEQEASLLNDVEAVELAFRSEISASPIITEISGRGLGLAIVKEKVEKLGGKVEVETHPGIGTTFRLQLPLTLATFRGIMVQVAGQQFVVPAASVQCVARVGRSEIQTVENRETILLNGHAVSLVRLEDILNLSKPTSQDDQTYLPVLVLTSDGQRIAFAVTQILGEQEVLVKHLVKPLVRVRNVAGATMLGSGKAIVVLNVTDLVRSATMLEKGPAASSAEASAVRDTKSILVVEDSITARMLLKNILESSGYRVKTAFDGLDGLTTLRTESFDLVVSDVEMPRMSGFDLTAKIRADKKLSETPVVLITALATKEDRERGIDVGANAYIVKSNFDQSDLLDVIRRFL